MVKYKNGKYGILLNSFKNVYINDNNINPINPEMRESFQSRRLTFSEKKKTTENIKRVEYINTAIKIDVKFKITVNFIPKSPRCL
ncbi:MAG: hypothetical protein JSV62_01955 [Promethearchaeota archaeon]|nr:MAG: hypothetical protein JSV62_01955 [Candidatus Lokiarchaeota archaeon]